MSSVDNHKNGAEPRWLSPASPSRAALVPSISAARWLLVMIVAAGIYFFYGFLVPVLAALVIGFASWPIYRELLRRVGGNTTIGATIALLLIITFLIVPIVIAASYTASEVREWFGWAVEVNKTGAPVPDWIAALPGVGAWFSEQWVRYIGTPGAIGEVIQLASGANIGNIYRAIIAAETIRAPPASSGPTPCRFPGWREYITCSMSSSGTSYSPMRKTPRETSVTNAAGITRNRAGSPAKSRERHRTNNSPHWYSQNASFAKSSHDA